MFKRVKKIFLKNVGKIDGRIWRKIDGRI